MLSDVGSDVIQRYGILNREMEPDSFTYGIPYPGTFLIDTNGRVTDRFFEQRYQERFTMSSIAIRLGDPLDGSDRDAMRSETDHLEVVAYASDAVVAPGNRFSLVLDVTPKPEMHVYAPGDHTYRVIQLRLDAPDFLRLQDLTYPQSETYHFDPLDETVPVYQQPFRLVQEVTIPMSRDIAAAAAEPGATLTIEGALEYQACDHEVCYVPAEIPMSWDFTWRPLMGD